MKILLIKCVSLVILLGFVFYFLQTKLLSAFTENSPAKLNAFYYLDEDNKQWMVRQVQPLVIGYKTVANTNYLIGIYPEDGKWNWAVYFVNGRIGNEELGKVALVEKSNNNSEILDFEQFKKAVPIGSRVRIHYLDNLPSDQEVPSNEFCELYFPVCIYPNEKANMYLSWEKNKILKPSEVSLAVGFNKDIEPADQLGNSK